MLKIAKLSQVIEKLWTAEPNLLNLYDIDGSTVVYSNIEVRSYLQQFAERLCDENVYWYWTQYRGTVWVDFLHMVHALKQDYNPIDNYNRDERIVDIESEGELTETFRPTSTTTTTRPVKTTSKEYTTTNDDNSQGRLLGYTDTTVGSDENAGTYSTTVTGSGSDTKTTSHKATTQTASIYTDSDTYSGDKVTIHYNSTKGNIGVTTSQQMIESEIELRKKNILSLYLDSFISRYTFYGGDCVDIDFVYN